MKTDIEFHRILFLTAKNPIFNAGHTALVGWLMGRWAMIERNDKTETLAHQGHVQIANAIEKGDPDAAEKAMNKHLSSSWAVWVRQIPKKP